MDFSNYGCLDFRFGSGEVVFLSLSGDDRSFRNHPLVADGPGSFRLLDRPQSYALRADGRTALISSYDGLYFFDASSRDLKEVGRLDRWGDSGFDQLAIYDLGSQLLCHYENGLVAVSETGIQRWSLTKVMWCWQFQGTSVDLVVFADQDGASRYFDAETGAERAV